MNSFLSYAVESLLITGILYLFYLVFLRSRPLLIFNRFILLLIVITGAVIPLVDFQIGNTTPIPSGSAMVQGLIEGVNISASSRDPIISWKIYYLGVSFVLLAVLGTQLYQLIRLHQTSDVFEQDSKKVRLFEGRYPHFSFFNTIYLNKRIINKPEELDYIVAHEQVHVNQRHSMDILLLELLKTLLWFNPFIWLIKPCMVENHEYLADKYALKKEPQRSFEYLNQLINNTLFAYNISIVNNFNHSLIKKRIAMMTKKKIRKMERFIPVLLIPFILGVVIVFACSKESSEKPVDTHTEKEGLVKVVTEEGDSVLIFKKQGEAAPEGVAVIGELENKRTRESKVEDQVFYIVEEMPTFQGGEAGNFRSFIMKNVVYPQEAKAKKEEGQVFVEFIVDATGSVTNVKVVRGVSPALDKEAIRVVQSSPAWGPGKQHGKNVPVKFTFPIMFSLQ